MDAISAFLSGLDGVSLFVGAALGLLAGGISMLTNRASMRRAFDQSLAEQKSTFDQSLSETKSAYESAAKEMKTAFESLSNEALLRNQQEFLELARGRFEDQQKQHGATLDSKKELIDQQLSSMSKTMTETLNTVPANLEKNETRVSEALGKSTADLKESNKSYLDQLTDKAEAQTKAHNQELAGKKELIDQRLTNMDVKLGKVEQLVQELQTDRKAQYGALGQQLQSLTSTTSSLQKALADNRARGQWGERMAEDILQLLGFVEGQNYFKQSTTEAGTRPDFTFMLPNQLSLNMDAKFPLDNYLRYSEAASEAEKSNFSSKFLNDVKQRVAEIQKRDYIDSQTVNCVLIFIPNEQVYRFIHEQDHSIIDAALRQRVILCSPLTLYIVLAVMRHAAQNFNVEQKSREIVGVVNEIRKEWHKYSQQAEKLERSFKRVHDDFHNLTGTRTRQLDRRFDKIDSVIDSSDLQTGYDRPLLVRKE